MGDGVAMAHNFVNSVRMTTSKREGSSHSKSGPHDLHNLEIMHRAQLILFMAGIKRFSFRQSAGLITETINSFKKEGLVRCFTRKLTVLDIEKLVQLIDSSRG